VETPQGRRKAGGSTRGAQEEHKRNTRATQESTSQSPGLCLACAWLWVPLPASSAFSILPSAFAPVWLWAVVIKREDALHVAHATVHGLDILLSWNFKHLANVRREGLIAAMNQQEGYWHALRLLSPLEVEDENQS
jgi:hypothetical protein